MEKEIKEYLKELKNIIDSISVKELQSVISAILNAYNHGRKIFVMGNGGSSATSSHFACDINKGVGYKLKNRPEVICLNDNIPIMLAYANDISFEDIFVEQLKNLIEKKDLVIAISSSGNSKNIIKAIEFANNYGAVTVGLTGNDGGKLASLCKYSLIVKSADMQKIEDMHMVVVHIIMQVLSAKL